jgi:hypothetical protein
MAANGYFWWEKEGCAQDTAHKKDFGGAGKVLFLDLGGTYKGVPLIIKSFKPYICYIVFCLYFML